MSNAQTQPAKFDLRTHYFDRRGRLISKDPYRLHINDGVKLFERPVGSGNLFYENNEPAGRVEIELSADGLKQTKKFNLSASHKAYVAPLTDDQKVIQENAALKAKNEALAAELAAIKAENDAKVVGMKPASKAAPAPAPIKPVSPITNYKDEL